jgi:hypothetical protein
MKKLNRQEVIDKLCQYDVYLITKAINNNDYSWLSDIREHGFKGYAKYTHKELMVEWRDSEDGYNSMIADNEQLYDIVSTSPMIRVPCDLEQDTKAFGGRR